MFLVIPMIALLEFEFLKVVWVIILLGGLTDYFDGHFAKRLKSKTKLGAIIDPLADKVVILVPLIWLSKNGLLPFWSISLIVVREFIVSAFRVTKVDGLPASKLAKLKTFFLFISLIFLISPFYSELLLSLGLIFYWLGFSFSLITVINYLRIK